MTETEQNTVVGAAGKLLGTLPAQFLMLCLIMVGCVGGLLWFVDRRATETGKLVAPIIAACLQRTAN